MRGITARTGNAPIKRLGHTQGQRFGTNRSVQVKGDSVSDEKVGSGSKGRNR